MKNIFVHRTLDHDDPDQYPRLEKSLDPSSQNMDLDKKKQWSQDNEKKTNQIPHIILCVQLKNVNNYER